ncbi:hypothetical protein [Pseudonocardia sp. KRD291]|uniref:hypothetical protein n=1 Tax=Pseudonocardia sp. KRD291 TaxID=2792007 RepID=UPI001C4A24F6|nr:hypothetical protein [Pseudonocardia sp. KRD291]MBW0101849.1 hypothetical protein [Pseudonocardia sp. KRD291]
MDVVTSRGKPLRPLRRREVLHRHLYAVDHPGPGGARATYTVEIDGTRDDGRAELYVDGRRQAKADMPASFPVPGATIEVAVTLYGVRRMHLVGDGGEERRLDPVPGTLEYRRGRMHRRHRVLSRVIGWLAIAILLVNLVLAVPEALELLTRIDRIAEVVGTFTSPVQMPGWITTTLIVAGVLAAVERALMLRRNRVIDFETLWTVL